jgi:hypothetical protein
MKPYDGGGPDGPPLPMLCNTRISNPLRPYDPVSSDRDRASRDGGFRFQSATRVRITWRRMWLRQRRYGCRRDRAAVKEPGSVAFVPRRRRCIDICPTAKPEAFENGRFIPKTGRSRKVSSSRRAAAVRRIPAVCVTEIERQGSTLLGPSARRMKSRRLLSRMCNYAAVGGFPKRRDGGLHEHRAGPP